MLIPLFIPVCGLLCSSINKSEWEWNNIHGWDPPFSANKDFVSFIAMVVNGTAQVETKSRKIDFLVYAAETLLGLKYFTSDELYGVLSCAVPPSQALEPEQGI